MEGLIRYLRFFEFSVVTCFLTGLEITWSTWDTCNITKVKNNFITIVSIQFHRFDTDCIYFQFKFLSCWTEIEPFLILVQFHFSRFITSLKMLFCKKVPSCLNSNLLSISWDFPQITFLIFICSLKIDEVLVGSHANTLTTHL